MVLDQTQFAVPYEIGHQPVACGRTDPEHLCRFQERETESRHFAEYALRAIRELIAGRLMMGEASTEPTTLGSSGKTGLLIVHASLRVISATCPVDEPRGVAQNLDAHINGIVTGAERGD
jgi:hypothetical protein